MSIAIRVENLSKAYEIGQIGSGTISRDIERWFVTKVMRREDPFMKVGEVNDRSVRSESNVVWSLRDVDLDIEQGDAVGLIGSNGAGKSTLLKLISRVTAPSTGKIKIRGRVASLLEVGTGFHRELTGRENVYLNGSLLGMRKREIDAKLDEIVDFSGIERYIDTPVKRYSSGMSVRLAFAVAAHLESEILIVDEVLAVGDAEFQRKCLGKMGDIRSREGRTLVFVSHNMGAVQEICERGILLHNGSVTFDGGVMGCISEYSQRSQAGDRAESSLPQRTTRLSISSPLVMGSSRPKVRNDEGFDVSIDVQAQQLDRVRAFMIIENMLGQMVVCFSLENENTNPELIDGNYRLSLSVPCLWLSPGVYSLHFKFLTVASNLGGRTISDRLMVEVEGPAERTGKAILNPRIRCETRPLQVDAIPIQQANPVFQVK